MGRESWHGDCSSSCARLGMVRRRASRKGSHYVNDRCEFEEVRDLRVLGREAGNQPIESEKAGLRQRELFVRTETLQGERQFQLPEIQEVGAFAVGRDGWCLALRKRGLLEQRDERCKRKHRATARRI